MGFPDISDIKKALRMAKNDINEAVAILTNDQPLNNEIDMQDISSNLNSQEQETHNEDGFPTTNLYELEQRVFQVNTKCGYKLQQFFQVRFLISGQLEHSIQEGRVFRKMPCRLYQADQGRTSH